ncbi:uncharacterized protein Nmag_3720 (plasmid) [Natrialba magadii ATCC 43099]|uniref:Uncharacterized protein n=1 Tax=Natrialba magadii (strain ATCC 43099 / DSM 3394 / CCM 3739 / CIP 104546 / IAM 13178 / JCM 8861 / NBRC 102185 / NCIMB 2190 / MS3) TaxID=547559 RepID=D3T103_NATMM|nr:hypothetical protein [Natrialba magadii]ADD07262.1 uncharacterized protein Nmag_3720 [Natrialba magadii ATCC 43099]ELY34371.1 hypothetical protein C500_00512 [Natrialba magadii ATCC 43099]
MIESVPFPAPVQATLLVGVILVQAVALYVGYGVLERVAMPLIETITDA